MKEPKSGSNRIQSFFDFETTVGKVRFGLEGNQLFYKIGTSKIYLTDSSGNALADDSVTTAKILDDAVTTAKILDGNVTAAKLAAGVVPVQAVKKTIGGIGITADFNFVTAANMNEQPIDLGAIIPALAVPLHVYLHTNAVFTGAVTLVADVGLTTGAAEFIASGTIYETGAILAPAAGSLPLVVPAVAAQHVWVNATPGANWSLVTAGLVTVYVTYVNVTNI